MLPISASRDLATSLLRLDAMQEKVEFQKLRVHMADGSVVVGALNTASAAHLSLLVGPLEALRQIPAADMHWIEIERPRRGREWLAAGSGALATVAAMVGIGALGEWSWITGGALTVFLPLFAAGVLGLRRMERHHWFRRWDTVYQGPRPAPMLPVR